MHLIDYILLMAVGAMLGAAIYFVRKGRSCCSSGCSGCCSSCSACCHKK